MLAHLFNRTARRKRIATLTALGTLLVLSFAEAQADGQWLESALDKAARHASPWELPLQPQAEEDTEAPADLLLPVERAPEPEIVLGVSWDEEVDPLMEEAERLQLEVRSVDEFEDPWADEHETLVIVPELVEPEFAEGTVAVEANPAETTLAAPSANAPSLTSPIPPDPARPAPIEPEDLDLVEPWLDESTSDDSTEPAADLVHFF